MCDGYAKPLPEIATLVRGNAKNLRAGKDEDFNKSKPLLAALPTFLLNPVVRTAGWLSSIGLSIPALGVKPYPFGN